MVAPGPLRVNDAGDAGDAGNASRGGEPDEVGGWLLLLCLLLLAGQPLALAFSAARALGALQTRGFGLVVVVFFQLIVAGVGVGAGLALLGRRRGAVGLAKWSLVLSALMDQVAYFTPYLPNNRLPGTTPLFAAASLAYYVFWVEYLLRSTRVRRTFPPG